MAETTPFIHQDVTRITLSLLPPDHIDRHVFEVQVESRDLAKGRWTVLWLGRGLSKSTEEWEYEPLPSSREDDWLDDHRFTYDEALLFAAKAVLALRVNGRTVQDLLQEVDGDA